MAVQEKSGRIVFQAKPDQYARFYAAKAEKYKSTPGALHDAEFAREVFEIGLRKMEKSLGLR